MVSFHAVNRTLLIFMQFSYVQNVPLLLLDKIIFGKEHQVVHTSPAFILNALKKLSAGQHKDFLR